MKFIPQHVVRTKLEIYVLLYTIKQNKRQ